MKELQKELRKTSAKKLIAGSSAAGATTPPAPLPA